MTTSTKTTIDYSIFGAVTKKPVTKIRTLIAKNMMQSWSSIPHVTHHDEVDVSMIEALRKQLNTTQKTNNLSTSNKVTAHFTLLSFILKAVVDTLKIFPEFNASLDENSNTLILKHYYHLGIAVDTPDGLIVPVIKNTDAMTFENLALAMSDLAERTRTGKLTYADTEGGSFSVTSLGAIGGTGFTPIIKTPEVAILGVSRKINKVVACDGEIVFRPMLPLSLSYDHRVIDGAMAARFMTHLRQLLTDPSHLIK
ncbi:MAG: pyruvate dehydrogenase E2 component (dihydrolipoamide acetyltransferase) [Cellvibrionaceae bacterium]|jgi:pyruvate dehydrogenase E2 component (dihydrolipoamide acetyltransferase)